MQAEEQLTEFAYLSLVCGDDTCADIQNILNAGKLRPRSRMHACASRSSSRTMCPNLTMIERHADHLESYCTPLC